MMRQSSSFTRHRPMLVLIGFIVCSGLGGALGTWAASLANTPDIKSAHQGSSIQRQALIPPPSPRNLATQRPTLVSSYGKLPLSFEANQGQVDNQVQFLARGRGYTLFLTPTEAVLALRAPQAENGVRVDFSKPDGHQTTSPSSRKIDSDPISILRMRLEGANLAPTVTGMDKLPGIVNYFIGNEPAKWHTNIPTYQKVEYKEVYEGIDLAYYGNQGQLEYDLIVAPGADPNQIKLAFQGADDISIDFTGNLVLTLSHPSPLEGESKGEGAIRAATLRLLKPHVYQTIAGKKVEVATSYLLRPLRERAGVRGASLHVGLQLASYDRTAPLIIDPILSYSTYLGGSGGDQGNGIAVDAAGNAYVAGSTDSLNFPTLNPSQPVHGVDGGISDAFVTKLDAAGARVYSTYLGGNGAEAGRGIAVDAAGAAYVIGDTNSANFPGTATSPIQADFGGILDVFVAKIAPTGATLTYATYLGDNGSNNGRGIVVDAAGAAYVTGFTTSHNFPGTATSPFQTGFGGIAAAFVAKVNAAGTALVYATYLGGFDIGDEDFGNGIAVDTTGAAYVIGDTNSLNFPTRDASQPGSGGGRDAFVTKLNAAGALAYSTYLGGSNNDQGNGIAVDAAGNAYVTGLTLSPDFPTLNAGQPSFGGGSDDAFVTKLNTAGARVYSTYLGGSDSDAGMGIAVDAAGQAYVTGNTFSTNFPTLNASQPGLCCSIGDEDVFVTKFDAIGGRVYSTYLGVRDVVGGIAVDAAGNAYVTGTTDSPNFPTLNASQPNSGGGIDAFVAKIAFTGNPFAWGTNTSGQLGRGNFAPGIAPAAVSGLTGVEAVAGGGNHSLALRPTTPTASSTVFSWGDNSVGQLGVGAGPSVSNVPLVVSNLGTDVRAITAGANHSLALGSLPGTGSSTVFAWGSNSNGQLGAASSTPSSNTPLAVSGLSGNIIAIAAGGFHSLAMGGGSPGSASSTVFSWGNNSSGQLGQASSTPAQVVGLGGIGLLTGISAIAAGANHSLAIQGPLGSASSTIFAWGSNSNGQLGTATSSGFNSGTPSRVLGPAGVGTLNSVLAVAGGNFHSLALLSGGTVRAWGRGDLGQLGFGGIISQLNTPIQVVGPGGIGFLTNIISIAAVGNASFALRNDGALFGWGDNSNGQVSNTSCSPTCNVPVQVQGQGGSGFLTNVVTVGGGPVSNHTLAISTTAPLANVIVPNVVGQPSAAAANTILTGAGLTLGTITITNNIAPAGQVLLQNPTAGSTVAPGTAVNLTVSSGPVSVPNVVGLSSAAAANTILTGMGLTLGTVTTVNNIAPAGQVLTQNPTAGSSVAPGTAVNLTVSSGPVSVPNVVGQPSSAAANTVLTAAGLTLGTVSSTANIAPVGQVLTQNPTSGSSVAPGTAVNLTVSAGLPPVSTSIDARMLKAAGFNTFEIVGQTGSLDTAVVHDLALAPSTAPYTLRAPFGGGAGQKTMTFKVNAQCDLAIP